MKRIAARHRDWKGFLLLSESDDSVVHEEHGTPGRYELDGEVLTVFWDRYSPDKFVKVSGHWIDEELLDKAVSIQDLNVVRAFGSAYLANRIQLSVPEAGTDVELRLQTSDVPTFSQVFSNLEYDIPELPKSASTIVDLGANIGLATLYFAARYPGAKILAVEPEPENFKVLLRNTSPLRSVRCRQAAVWTHDGEISLRTKDESNRSLEAWGVQVTPDSHAGDVRAPCFRLASLLELAGFEMVDILKVDIEGAELELFSEGIYDCLPRIQVIIIETHDRFRPGSESAVRRALAAQYEERPRRGENLIFKRNSDL